MKTKMKKILIPGIILGFVLMLMNLPAAFAQQQAVTAEKAAVKQQAAAAEKSAVNKAEKSAVNKMETQMPAVPTSKSEASVTQNQKKAATKMESTTKKAVWSNHEIKLVQEALNKDGYKLKTDGILGMHTSNAIKNFQKKNDLKVTGQPDMMTLAKLNLKNVQ